MSPLETIIADDHPVYRQGLTRLLKSIPEVRVVGEADSGASALETIRELKPDMALIDVSMPGIDGIGVVEALTAEGSPTKVVLVSGAIEPDHVYRAVAAGACGFLSKVAAPEDIRDAILAVTRGQTALGPEAQAALAGAVRRREDPGRLRLSDREFEVLERLASGLSSPAIGEQLFLSTATVKSHLATLYQKLGVSDRAAAVAVAMRMGLLH